MQSTDDQHKRAEVWLMRGVTEGVYPGASLLVAQGDDILFSGYAGQASRLPELRPMTESTRFDVASLTKVMATTSLLLILSREHGFDLKTERVFERFTLWELLHHVSGLPAWSNFASQLPVEIAAEGRDAVIAWLRTRILETPLEARGGDLTCYSDLGYLLLGFFIEALEGAPISDVFQTRIAEPLGLKDTRYEPLSDSSRRSDLHFSTHFAATRDHCAFRDRQRIFSGEVDDDNTAILDGIAGHAGLFSTAKDVHRLSREWVRAARGEPSLVSHPLMPTLLASRPPFGRFHVGFDTPSLIGSQAGRHFPFPSIGHLGFTGCSIWIDLTRDFTVILLSNRLHPSADNDTIKRFRPMLYDAMAEIFLSV